MEVQIQHYCLNHLNKKIIFIIFLLLLFILYLFFFLSYKKFHKNNYLIEIHQGSSINNIVNIILAEENIINKKIYLTYLKFYNKFYRKVNFGEFKFKNKLNLIQITNLISKPSNYYRKLNIIGGWQNYQINKLIKEKFNNTINISYNDIIADTYNYQSHNNILEIFDLMKISKDKFFQKHKDKEILKKYTIDQIMIISSLVEKEGKKEHDKRLISSVIFNRLDKNLKLEIDATTIFSITKGNYKYERKLTYNDLKIKNKYNTYYIKGLPPEPICYVSRKTIEIVLENYKSNYLFYFFNKNNNKHFFSESFKEHKSELKKYRMNL